MNVMAMARSIGLVTDDRRAVSGTIDEAVVLASIAELAAGHAGDDDLFADAAMRVQLARSAGVVQADETSVLHRSRDGAPPSTRQLSSRHSRPSTSHTFTRLTPRALSTGSCRSASSRP